MAGTLTLNVQALLNHSPFNEQIFVHQQAIVTTNLGRHAPIVSVGTSEEDMPIGEVATAGWLLLKNLDSTNYVTWGPKSGGAMVAMGRLKAGECALFRMDPTPATLRWIANTAAVLVAMWLLDN